MTHTTHTTRTNHWGFLVDSDVPITGVFSNNSLSGFVWDEESVDPDADEYEAHCQAEYEAYCQDDHEQDADNSCIWDIWDGYEQSTALIGYVEADGYYEEDPTAEYSAILSYNGSFNASQVTRSVWLIRCALCSPCFPGQADADTPGDYLAYSFPPDLVDDEEVRSRIFRGHDGPTSPIPAI